MNLKIIKLEDKQSNPEEWIDVVYRGTHKVIYTKKLHKRWHNLHKDN